MTDRGHTGPLLGFQWAPLRVPMARRLQTLASCCWFVTFMFGGFIGCALLALIFFFTPFWYISVAYLIFLYFDFDRGHRGSRWWPYLRNLPWWHYFKDFFPVTLVKTAELDPKRNYLLCVYPHGVLSVGAFTAFGTDALDVRNTFPGFRTHLITLAQNFTLPLVREIAMGLGACASSEQSIRYLMSDSRGGRMAVLIVGGAAEALLSRTQEYHIVLNRRSGFCRIALEEGCPLVPVFAFGEHKVYAQVPNPEGSFLLRAQEFLRSFIGLAPVLVIGRGIFQYTFGMLPRRTPVAIVVGAPIEVERVVSPSTEQIADLHRRYTEALVELYETHRHTYHPNEDVPLVIH